MKAEIWSFGAARQNCHRLPPWWNVSKYDSRRSVRGIRIRPPKCSKEATVWLRLFVALLFLVDLALDVGRTFLRYHVDLRHNEFRLATRTRHATRSSRRRSL